jgi:hypothetical protein
LSIGAVCGNRDDWILLSGRDPSKFIINNPQNFEFVSSIIKEIGRTENTRGRGRTSKTAPLQSRLVSVVRSGKFRERLRANPANQCHVKDALFSREIRKQQ